MGRLRTNSFSLPNDTNPYLNGYTPPPAGQIADHEDEGMGSEALDQVSALPSSVGRPSTDAAPGVPQTSVGPSSLPLTSPPSLTGAQGATTQLDPDGGDIANIAELEGMICTMEDRFCRIPRNRWRLAKRP